MSDQSVFASRGRGKPSESSQSQLDNSRLNTLQINRQRVRGLIRNFTGPGKNKPKPATVTENWHSAIDVWLVNINRLLLSTHNILVHFTYETKKLKIKQKSLQKYIL